MNAWLEAFFSPLDMRVRLGVLAAAFAIDLLVGELPVSIHPVVWIGKMIAMLVKLAPKNGRVFPFLVGLLIALATPAAFTAAAIGILYVLRPWPIFQLVCTALILKSMFALRALGKAAAVVRDALNRDNLDEARFELRSLCSRDASVLMPPQLAAATIESVAENTSDSFIAPLFYYVLFGVSGAVFYRVVNTLDSMIGYHGKYEYLGKASARFDDLLNLIPARMTAALLLLGGAFAGQDFRLGLCTMARDGGLTESPNAGRPMAAMAGLLQVELEKPGHYRLGNPLTPLSIQKINDAWRVAVIAAWLGFVLYAGVLGAVHVYLR